jgi:hypothetical protein
MITEQSVITSAPDLTTAYLDGEAVILDLQSGQYYGLNEVGARIFNLVQEPRSVGDVIDQIVEEYAVETDQFKQDLLAFLESMAQRKLIKVENGGG